MIFCFENYNQLLAKVKYERTIIDTTSENIEFDIYSIFNIILSLNHIFEWYYKDVNIDKKKRFECIEIFNNYKGKSIQKEKYKQFHSMLKIPLKINTNQLIIRQISNNLKHFKMNRIKSANKRPNYIAVAGNITCGSANAVCGYHEEYKYIAVTNSGDEYNLISIIDELIITWNNFLK